MGTYETKNEMEMISMEEYLEKRHRIRETEARNTHRFNKMAEKSTALELAALCV